MLHPSIIVAQDHTIHEKGLVATALIPCGAIVWQFDAGCRCVPCAEVSTWPEAEQEAFRLVAFQCDASHYAVCEGIDRYMNHSCDPNTWWSDDLTLVARRDIAPGEEVTCDYATFETAVPFRMACECGSPRCRRAVTHLDCHDAEWQRLYGVHLPRHVLETIKSRTEASP
jgi:hypothetical protein